MAVGAVFALLSLAGCSSSGGPTTAGTSAPGSSSAPAATANTATASTITIKDFAFTPADLTVAPGTVITVVNKDSTAHTLTATGSKAFDTGTLGAGNSATITAPAQDGSYPYICTIHQYMKGTLTVKASRP
ncbi:metal-binding protein [Streptomyces tateyamensis]|uniref:Metal-binding protein n=2 Tax=Streptomyces tateyamensis TaxID=565073 RepID=A0A2V4NLU0_9ACTN|nr:metal-binding protein [Streptomyces tateyamensis]